MNAFPKPQGIKSAERIKMPLQSTTIINSVSCHLVKEPVKAFLIGVVAHRYSLIFAY